MMMLMCIGLLIVIAIVVCESLKVQELAFKAYGV